DIIEARGNAKFEFSEDPSFWNDHNVQVIIRTRPLNSYEISLQGRNTCVRQDSSQMITWTGHPESRFTFDLVADEHVSQEMLFKVAGVPMVENCMAGYNSCMFAYGQTGSGKTHTMLGDIEGGSRRHSVNCGMTPRVFDYLFSRIQKDKDARRDEKLKFTCRCSFLEIYNEQILDLLDPSSTNLQIREDSKKGIHVENITEVEVTSARDAIQQLIQGSANRKVAATNMNRASSRSHSVFTCIIESKWELQGVTHHRFARLNLVDLAGSERQKSSGAEGERLKEATNINKSLSTLGLVIMNLVNISNGKSLHVPYRDSKLTFLLQDSLGGNAKTIIIANISPSSCCSLETLSTLKFAQRAKFIKNHAVVNEDASGNVLALKLENQNLKKEISQLKILVNGGIENHSFHALSTAIPVSPGSVAWTGQHELSSPLVSHKKASHKKDYEVALLGAIQREKDKDASLQALAIENQAAMQLVKEREDEVQCLKMRLKFREAAIKRLEGVASGKISAETHLLADREEHVKEIDVLRSQVERNQQATRFATENLKLKEEIRRLKSFCEEGERERMNEQITVLESQLLEALDWKLMHESHLSTVKKTPKDEMKHVELSHDTYMSLQECALPWQTITNEENEILRLQNESEINSLRQKLELCIEEKERLERHVIELEKELEEAAQRPKEEVPSVVEVEEAATEQNDQTEQIKTMVDAIAAASQREAEAHETAILLSKENDELRMKLKVLIEDNNRLIDLYENTAATDNPKITCGDDEIGDAIDPHLGRASEEEGPVLKRDVERLESQLAEMYEENEKLFGLYEKAMQERDELKRKMLSSDDQSRNAEDSNPRMDDLVDPEAADQSLLDETCLDDALELVEIDENSRTDLSNMRRKLVDAQEKLAHSAEVVSLLGSLERAIVEIDDLSAEINASESCIAEKEERFRRLRAVSSELVERKHQACRKLCSLKLSLSHLSSSLRRFEELEALAESKLYVSTQHMRKTEEELSRLRTSRGEITEALVEIRKSETELENDIRNLKSKAEEENRKVESEKGGVLIAIDNVEKPSGEIISKKNYWQCKATELLKAEEERAKLCAQLKLRQQRLDVLRKESESKTSELSRIETEAESLRAQLEKHASSAREASAELEDVSGERAMLADVVREDGRREVEKAIVELYECCFEAETKDEEARSVEGELRDDAKRLQGLRRAREEAAERKTDLRRDDDDEWRYVCDKVEADLCSVRELLHELNFLM
ncbi:hypothetical protein M569_13753, partial [Genlisea aurea]